MEAAAERRKIALEDDTRRVLCCIDRGFQTRRRAALIEVPKGLKAEDIAAFPRTEIMPNMFVWAYKKARCFFAAKRTKPLEITTSTFQLDVFAYDILDIEPSSYLFLGILHSLSIPC